MTRDGLADVEQSPLFQCLSFRSEAMHKRENGRDWHEACRHSDGCGDLSARSLQRDFKMFDDALVTHGS